jgi:small GTP-binding protein
MPVNHDKSSFFSPTMIARSARKEKIVMIGPAGSGKTAITNRIVHDTFRGNTVATVGASYQAKSFTVNGASIRLDIWDTGGSEKYRALAPIYYREARAAIIVFDVTAPHSLIEAHTWIRELRAQARPDMILIAAANKIDAENLRALSKDQIESFRFENQLDYCVEVSAKTGQNIDQLFRYVCEALVRLTPAEIPEGPLLPQDTAPNDSGCFC